MGDDAGSSAVGVVGFVSVGGSVQRSGEESGVGEIVRREAEVYEV